MGTSGVGLFADDIACDVRDEFLERLGRGFTPEETEQKVLHSFAAALDDVDDGPVVRLALAMTQWKCGCLSPECQAAAFDVIERGSDLHRWEGAARIRRSKVLESVRQTLLSQQPPARRPRRRKPIKVASTTVPSPDGTARATAFELAKSPIAGAPQSQVMIELEANGSRGGGGVFVADCGFEELGLAWLDADTLCISHPASANISSKSESTYYCGRQIQIKYVTTVHSPEQLG